MSINTSKCNRNDLDRQINHTLEGKILCENEVKVICEKVYDSNKRQKKFL